MHRLISLFLVCLTGFVYAQDKGVIIINKAPQGEFALVPLKVAPMGENEKYCGPYFIQLTTGPRIAYAYTGATNKIGMMGAMLAHKFVTKIDNTKKTPTVEMVTASDQTITSTTKVVVRISQIDFEKTEGCLPKPLQAL